MKKVQAETKEFEEILRARLDGFGFKEPKGNQFDWIYRNNIEEVWEDYLQAHKEVVPN